MEKISRFKDIEAEKLSRIFSPSELEYAFRFSDSLSHLAGMYCAKEALVKALDDKTLIFNKLSVEHTASGKPYFNTDNYLTEILNSNHKTKVELSISHTKKHAIAVVSLD